MKRSAMILTAAVLTLSACSGGSDSPAPTPSGQPSVTSSAPGAADPSALSEDGGVQVWDLTGKPSDASFGIDTSTSRADYGTSKPRDVRFDFDGGSIDLTLKDLTFYHEDDVFAFLSRTAEIPGDRLARTYRDVLEQLDVDTATADTFEDDLAKSSRSDTGQITVSYPDEIRLGDWTVAVSVATAPAVGTGVVTVSAGYRPLQTS